MPDTDQNARIGRVESEVQGLTSSLAAQTLEIAGIKADVRGLGAILTRIEHGVEQAQERSAEREQHSRPNVTAMVSILITIISIIVGGAWIIGGSLSRQDERSEWVKGDMARLESRQWEINNRSQRPPVAERNEPVPYLRD